MISNSSPLIVFGKIGKMDLLFKVYEKIEIAPAVYFEVVEQGAKINAPESFLIKEFVEQGLVIQKKLDLKWKKQAIFFEKIYSQIDCGEAETIALAMQENQKTLLMDEKIAREIAILNGIQPYGSLKALLLAFKNKIITERELRETMLDITSTKFRLSAEVINKFWILFEKLKKKK